MRRTAMVLAVVMLAGVLVPGRAGAAPQVRPEGMRVVTLVTGDRVRVGGERISVEPAPGRARMAFHTSRFGGHARVIPADAVPLLQDGRLDARLFDVTGLAAAGYDDRRADLPLIVRPSGSIAAMRKALPGTRFVRDLPAVHGLAVRAATKDLAATWPALKAGSSKIWLDGMRTPALDQSVPQVNAPTAWQAGYDGTGVVVAVLDSGVDTSHPDLAGAIAGTANFTDGFEDDRDITGHGTHVASTIAGSGAASGGRYRGVAPGAKVLSGKVCAVAGCAESWILAGMQWAAEQGAKVVNLSLGGRDFAEVDPLEEAVQTLTNRYGILFVAAAGNAGTGPAGIGGTVSSPASADAALAVGAVTRTDQLYEGSSRGPRAGDAAVKPEITAPGVDIVAARGADSAVGQPGESYATLTGTSMATPHVTGAAAILAQRHLDWSPERLKAALTGAARPAAALGVYEQGAGRLDVGAALTRQVTVLRSTVNFGRQTWPHDDDKPVTVPVTYHNGGPSDVRLTLSLRTGVAAGVFTLGASTLTVPAGASASVDITADTRSNAPSGPISGYLTATGAGHTIQTPFAVDVEAEFYDLTLRHTDRSGRATAAYGTRVVRLDDPGAPSWWPYDADGTATIRLPRGRYQISSLITDGAEESFLLQPRLELDRPQQIAVDAQRSRPVSIDIAGGPSRTASTEVLYHAQTVGGPIGLGVYVEEGSVLRTARLGPDVTIDGDLTTVYTVATRPGHAYYLAWADRGRMITGFDRRVTLGQLATVHAAHARDVPGGIGVRAIWAKIPGAHLLGMGASLEFTLPHARTEHYTTGGGVAWESDFVELAPDPELGPQPVANLSSTATAYQPGRTYAESWNAGVFGPCLPHTPASRIPLGVTRAGDTVSVQVPLYCDGARHFGLRSDVSGQTRLSREGTMLGRFDYPGLGRFAVPAADGGYRLEIDAMAGDAYPLATRTSLIWTFRSGHVDGTASIPVPYPAFVPALDPDNTAPAGRVFPVPVVLDDASGRVASVDASFDDGRSWRAVPVRRNVALVPHPTGRGYVSLRLNADSSSGHVELTVIGAYQFG